MFTGIVEETGVVKAIKPGAKSIALTVETRICGSDLKLGDSLAVNGCCLTVVKLSGPKTRRLVQMDLLQETWTRTNLQHTRGHIDGLGTIKRWEKSGADYVLEITAPQDILRYMVFKGSIAIDGISLTVAEVKKKSFVIWIIPHTHAVTALRERKVGDLVNLEADMLAKYVERFTVLKS
ncbi:MAG: riboflavin synthase, alpha subunit [Verrucomicrobia bacterium]|nr:riboflavin synthase, alpha subunit [Verrucomicrobiota bacterium]